MHNIVKVIRVFEGETVEIQWMLKDGSDFTKRYTIPPKSTIDYSRLEDKEEIKENKE